LRSDIFDLIGYVSQKGMMAVLGSNAILIDDEMAKRLKDCGLSGMGISLHSFIPEIHDSFCGVEGAWKDTIAGIEACQRQNLEFQIQTSVTNDNHNEIMAMVDFSKRLGAKVFSPFFLVCTGRGQELTDITPHQYEELLTKLARNKSNGIMVRPRCAPTYRRILYQDASNNPILKTHAGKCLAGTHYLRITPEGDVTPCPYMPLKVGNVREQSFTDIWKDSRELRSFRYPKLKGKCGVCEFQSICGGCRARAFSFHGDYLEEDGWCLYEPKNGEVIEEESTIVESSDRLPWTHEAEERIKRVPFFVRGMVRNAVEKYAEKRGFQEITSSLMDEVKGKMGKHG
jgi:radical SAM protein with 4Fe4S-binding SPASM domain